MVMSWWKSGHIKIVYTELPRHLNWNEKEMLEYAIINTVFVKKDTKSSVDYC